MENVALSEKANLIDYSPFIAGVNLIAKGIVMGWFKKSSGSVAFIFVIMAIDRVLLKFNVGQLITRYVLIVCAVIVAISLLFVFGVLTLSKRRVSRRRGANVSDSLNSVQK
jgi:hypothetical protein